jgi:hypothetical protein
MILSILANCMLGEFENACPTGFSFAHLLVVQSLLLIFTLLSMLYIKKISRF